MSCELTLSCRTEDPTDAVSRILMLLARCSIRIAALVVCREAGAGFVADFRLEQPLPIAAENLADRVRQIPSVSAANLYRPHVGDRRASGVHDQCSFTYMS